MNNYIEPFFEACKIISSDLVEEEHDVVTVSVYSEQFSSPQKQKNYTSKGLLDFDDVDLSYELKSKTNIAKTVEPGTIFKANPHISCEESAKQFSSDDEISVFESVRATVNKEVYHTLDLQNECEIINVIKNHMKEAVHFYKLEYDQLVIVGCLNDLIFCQKYLSSCLQKRRDSSKRTSCIKSQLEKPLLDTEEIEVYSENDKINSSIYKKKAENISLPYLKEEPKSSLEFISGEKSIQNSSFLFELVSPDIQLNVCDSHNTSCKKQELYQFSCHICSYKCTRRSHLLKHKSKHQKNTKLYYCDRCEFKTMRLSQLGKHKKTHQENSSFPEENMFQTHSENSICIKYTANECDTQVENSKENSDLQEKNKDQNKFLSESQFPCKICSFVAKQKKEMKAHIESAHPIKYCCNQCEYSTYKKVHYVRHMKCVHENERPYVCSECSMAFKRCDALTQHQVVHAKEAKKQDHNAKSLFKCHICKKAVRSAADLKEHLLTHSEERSFLCEICGSAFKTRAVHRNHMRVVHSEEGRPFCQTCGKTFATKFSLSRHMSQHGIRSHGMWSNVYIDPPELLSSEATERAGS